MKSKFTWIFTLLLAFFIQFAFAQEKTVTGVVSDATGALPGVTVMVKGNPASAVTTDIDGKYTITASVGQKLVFSYISMTNREITVGNANSYNVEMAEEIDEVIVDKYRTQTRANNPTAVTTITAATIEGRPNASFIQTLQGQVPGLNILTGSGQPGANSTVILRGIGSISGNIEPLYVIDGVPLTVDNFRSINPNDIESVSVLKDAGATSIYGNRGANGVIVVKTKRGSFESPLKVSYTGITSFQDMQDHKYRIMNSRELLTLENTAGRGLGSTMTPEEIAAFNIDTDWKNEFFRTGVTQNHVVTLSSGGTNLSSFTSFGYFDQQGIVENTDLKRFNFRNNLSGKSNNGKFNYQTALTLNWSRRNEASNLGTGAVNINPVIGANQGVPYLSPSQYTNGLDLYNLEMAGESTLLYTPLELLDQIKTFTSQTDELKAIGNIQASYQINDDFTFATAFGTDYTQAIGLRVQDPESFNSYLFQNEGEDYLGFQTESLAYEVSFNFNTSLNYNHTFAEKHTIDASVYTEYFKSHSKSFSAIQSGLDPKVFEPGNGAGYIPFNPDTPAFYVPSVSSGKAMAGLFSYFGSLDYDYDQKYGLAATVRRDASYRFNESNRWGTFWSVSGRWNIDKEAFMENSVFSMLKLRASYGTAGNQNISGQSMFTAANLTRTLYGVGTGYGNLPAYFVSQYGNDDLKWEVITQANIGLDFELWNAKLRGNLDVYQKTTDDLFIGTPISGVNGTYNIQANYGSLRNRGVELLLGYDIIDINDFKLTLNFNGSYNQNKIIDIAEPDGQIDNELTVLQEGYRINEFFLTKYAGVNPANGNLLFYDANGALTENPALADRRHTGKSSVPSYQGGFGFDASYKGFFLTTSFTYVADVYRFDYDLAVLQDPGTIGQFNKSKDLQRAWTEDNRITDIPRLGFTNESASDNSDRYLKDASYVRLRYASIGYNVPKDFLKDTPFTGVKAYFQAENLVTWSKWRGWDAESNRGADQNQYPTPRILSVGLEVNF